MEAHEAAFTFMRGAICVEVPFFQRPYVWNKDNWSDLIEDLFDCNSSHFLGSIILKSIKTPSGEQPRWSLIDGQQRLTTLSVLLRACFDSLPIDRYSVGDQEQIKNDKMNMLTYKTQSIGGKTKLKINHSRVDSEEFSKVILGEATNMVDDIVFDDEAKGEKEASHLILQCYRYFRDSLNAQKAELIWNLLLNDNAKILVKIDLESDENEQAIFDTVNSAGVRLTCADTIKNSLFQELMENAAKSEEKDDVIEFYSSTWEKTFARDNETIKYWATVRPLGRISRDNLEILLHCVALIEGIYDPDTHKMSDLPQIYKQHIKNLSKDEVHEFVENICGYAKTFYRFFYTFDETSYFGFDLPVLRLFHILETCDISTFYAYVLKILNGYESVDEVDIPQSVLDELHNIESIAMRYTICRESTKNFNKDCAELIAGKTTTADLLTNTNVDDNAFATGLRDVRNKHAKIILFWTELKRRAEDKKCSEKDLKYAYSLEHVMPQKWQEHWPITNPQVLDANTGLPIDDVEEAEAARNAAVYEVGNMVLLNRRLNTALRNYNIQRKMDGEGRKKGIKAYNALFSTNDIIEVYDQSGTWDEQSIRARTEEITKHALSVW